MRSSTLVILKTIESHVRPLARPSFGGRTIPAAPKIDLTDFNKALELTGDKIPDHVVKETLSDAARHEASVDRTVWELSPTCWV